MSTSLFPSILLFPAIFMMSQLGITLPLAAKELPDPDGKPADLTKKVKVFIIMGQSNTLEMGRVKGDKEGTLEHAVKKENLYPFMVDDSGNWTKRMDVRNVHTQGSGGLDGRGGVRRNDWLTVSGGKIGIEIGIGITVAAVLITIFFEIAGRNDD